MTVAELIKKLQKFNGGIQVVLASDAEGNDFRNLASVEPGYFVEDENTLYTVDSAADSEEYTEDKKDNMKMICLWPV